ncbi:MAG: hypothetical protein LBR65_07360 [Culturomica sp.]|jgi:hypothetical protein|nr:hypothetical protein [Culturomica sp.]
MKKIKLYTKILPVLLLSFSACESMMDVELPDALDAGEHYSSSGEVYGAFFGINATFTKVTEQTILLAGLKGDLMEPTSFAPESFWSIYRYEADNTTPYTGSAPYYDIVINCNDFIKRLVNYNLTRPGEIPEAAYRGMLSQAICYKTWSLMMIGQFWGEARFYNEPLTDDSGQGMVLLNMDALPSFLISYMREGVAGVDAFQDLDWKVVLDNPAANWNGRMMEPNILLGELSLWNKDYSSAFDSFLKGLAKNAENLHPLVTRGYLNIFSSEPHEVFTEVISGAVFDTRYHQTHNLTVYFTLPATGVQSGSARYYIRPNRVILDLYDTQVDMLYGKGDFIRKSTAIYEKIDIIGSYRNEYAGIDKFQSDDSPIPVYRSGQVFLNVIEALAFMGRYEEAFGLLNGGLRDAFDGTAYEAPFQAYPADLKESYGIRSRVQLSEYKEQEVFGETAISSRDSLVRFLGVVADEIAMELSFEGKRWPTLVRMARNLQDPAFLADRVSRKFENSGETETYRNLLLDPANWYIKDDEKNTLK